MIKRSFLLLAAGLLFHIASSAQSIMYDLVLSGGRVMDPETGLDAVRNVGINGGRVAMISESPLQGKETVDVKGLVVSPGFIDLHVHGRTNKEQEFQAHDGVTTALELEWGIEYPGNWYATRVGKALINFGASVNWGFDRFRALPQFKAQADSVAKASVKGEMQLDGMFNIIRPSYGISLTAEQSAQTIKLIQGDLDEGAIGIGLPIGYIPKAKADELYNVYKFAGEAGATIFTHAREPNMLSIQEAIANAVLTGAPLHIVHVNSMALGQIGTAIGMVRDAQKKGYDITTELYPYTAASTLLQSALFAEGWQERLGMDYGDIQWQATGERLTKETFEKYRKEGGVVIMHLMKPEWIKEGIASPLTIIASDGMPYAPLAHPRTAGTFSRVLGKYVREEKALPLNLAITKMTLMPARRLESIAPSMRFKGRIQVGSDADITVFDPNTVTDKATFEKGLAFSEGITHVIVNGRFVIHSGKTVPNSFPGKPFMENSKSESSRVAYLPSSTLKARYMKKAKIIFWVTTTLLFLFEGLMPALTSQTEMAKEGIRHLGYPEYMGLWLTVFKVVGAIVLIIPQVPARVKEWAYACFAVEFLFAFISHLYVDGPVGESFFPLLVLAVLIVSYVYFHKINRFIIVTKA